MITCEKDELLNCVGGNAFLGCIIIGISYIWAIRKFFRKVIR